MLDLFVEFGALVAHGGTLSNRKTGATLIGCMMESTAGMGICSSRTARFMLAQGKKLNMNKG